MTLVLTVSPGELGTVRDALVRLHNTELKKLRTIQKKENAGKPTRVRASEQAMYLAEIKMLHTRVAAQLTEVLTIINKERNHG